MLILEPVPDMSDTAQEMVAPARSSGLCQCEGSNERVKLSASGGRPRSPRQPAEKQPASVLTSFLPSCLPLTCVECLCFSLKHISDLPRRARCHPGGLTSSPVLPWLPVGDLSGRRYPETFCGPSTRKDAGGGCSRIGSEIRGRMGN